MRRVKFTKPQKAEINRIVTERLAEQRAKDQRDTVKLRKCFDEVLKINEVLGAHLENLELENIALRRELSELTTLRKVAMWRRGRIVSWRAWWRTAAPDD